MYLICSPHCYHAVGEATSTNTDNTELRRTLGDLSQLLPGAVATLDDVRSRLAVCWPTAPSRRGWLGDARNLYDAGMRLVAAAPHNWGELYLAIEAANSTLDAYGQEPPADSAPQHWSLGRVDRAVQRTPEPAASAVLAAALPAAEAVKERIHRQLDEVAQIAPVETWLPECNLDDARAYVALVKWKQSWRPPHQYTVREWRPELRRDFLAFAQLVQSRGEIKTWGEYVDAYLEVDGFEYWTLRWWYWRLPETRVINRAAVGAPEAAEPLPRQLDAELRRRVELALGNRRRGRTSDADTGILGKRLRALLENGAGA
jgi:hypothetical protein